MASRRLARAAYRASSYPDRRNRRACSRALALLRSLCIYDVAMMRASIISHVTTPYIFHVLADVFPRWAN